MTTREADGSQTQGNEGSQTQGIDEVREWGERMEARAKKAEGQLESLTFKAIGLDPDKGMGKAFKTVYDGPINPDSIGEITTFLDAEFDYQVPKAQPEEPRSAKPDVSEGERELQDLKGSSRPAPIDPAADARTKAAEEGNWEREIELGILQGGIEF